MSVDTDRAAIGADPHLALGAEAQALLFTEARTANSFSSEPVDDATLRSIWELSKWGPTAANTNPLRVLYVRTGEAKQRLVGHMSEGNQAKTASAPAVAVLAADTRFHDLIPTLLPFRPELKDAFEDESAREPMWQFGSALQAGYFILGVRAAGLVAGPMAGFDKEGVDGEFFAGTSWRSILVVNIGHPGEDPWFDRLPRPDFDTAVQMA